MRWLLARRLLKWGNDDKSQSTSPFEALRAAKHLGIEDIEWVAAVVPFSGSKLFKYRKIARMPE